MMIKLIRPHRQLISRAQQCKALSDSSKSNPPPNPNAQEKSVEAKKYDQKDVTKEDLQWRTPWYEKQGAHLGMLRSFYSEDSNRGFLQLLQTPLELSPSAIRNWWLEKKIEKEKFMQQYIPERHQVLGNELAAAHFLVYRGGSVKFHGEDKWIKANEYQEYSLPPRYREGMYLQAIDCTDMKLHYEGLCNLRGLSKVQWLSLNGCQYMDDFCMDVITNVFSHSLLYLDLRNCMNISKNGIGALYKMRKLRTLYLDDLLKDTYYEMTCLLLEEANPNLEIKSDVINFELK